MDKRVFNKIKQAVEAIAEIKGGAMLYVSQMERDILRQFPFVLVEMGTVNYKTLPNRVQVCDNYTFLLHLIVQTIDRKEGRLFDVSQALYVGMLNEGYVRVSERANYNNPEYVDWIVEFSMKGFVDDSGVPEAVGVVAAPAIV